MSIPSKKFKPSYEIDDLNLHPNIINKLKKANLVTFKSILHLSLTEIQKIGKISSSEAKATLDAISSSLLIGEPESAHEIAAKEKISHNLLHLNVTKGNINSSRGIYTKTITEISGESGCGKTQLCLHLSIMAQLPPSVGGLSSKVIYIHTEGDFPIKRFMQLANGFSTQYSGTLALNLSNNLILKRVHNLNAMMHVLQNGIPSLVKKQNPKLIVIDSVAALLRSDYESVNERTSAIQRFGAEIYKLANVFKMAVICVNQVSGQFKKNEGKQTSYVNDVPSLGLLWSSILTTRFKITKKSLVGGQTMRVLESIFSSYHPNVAYDFIISEDGVQFQ